MTRLPMFRDAPPRLRQLVEYGPYLIRVQRWRDGDTLEGWASVGFDWPVYVSLRLNNASAPESWEPNGPQAKAYVESLAPPHGYVVAYTEKQIVHSELFNVSFDRYVARVVALDPAGEYVDVGEALTAAGLTKE